MAKQSADGAPTMVLMVSPAPSVIPTFAARFLFFYNLSPNVGDFSLQCLNVNLGAGFIKLASASEENWICLLCKSAPLEKLRTNLLAPLQVNHSITLLNTSHYGEIYSRERLKWHSAMSDQLEHGHLGRRCVLAINPWDAVF